MKVWKGSGTDGFTRGKQSFNYLLLGTCELIHLERKRERSRSIGPLYRKILVNNLFFRASIPTTVGSLIRDHMTHEEFLKALLEKSDNE